jgi:hypothetical protein
MRDASSLLPQHRAAPFLRCQGRRCGLSTTHAVVRLQDHGGRARQERDPRQRPQTRLQRPLALAAANHGPGPQEPPRLTWAPLTRLA